MVENKLLPGPCNEDAACHYVSGCRMRGVVVLDPRETRAHGLESLPQTPERGKFVKVDKQINEASIDLYTGI